MRSRPCLIHRSISRREPAPALASHFWTRSDRLARLRQCLFDSLSVALLAGLHVRDRRSALFEPLEDVGLRKRFGTLLANLGNPQV